MHAWPPSLVAWSHWPELWDEIVRIYSFPVADIEDAAARVRLLIERIAAAGRAMFQTELSATAAQLGAQAVWASSRPSSRPLRLGQVFRGSQT